MLPSCRTEGEGFSIPTFDLVPSDVEGFMDELWEFQSAFHDCFGRSEPRAHFFDYMVGQFSHLERKSIEPMALQVEGGNIRGLQRFISDDVWDEEQMLWNYHHLVADAMGAPDGVLMFDESGFVKKGTDSVGVARQYCGSLGKVENSQVGVFAAYASCHGYALVDKRLFIPEQWFAEDYKDRRAKCQVPEDATFHTKPQLAAAMLQAMAHEGLVPFKYIVADCVYGNSPAFLDAVDACVGVTALVAISSETRCWLQAPRTTDKMYMYKGALHSKRVVVGSEQAPCTVAALAARLPASSWYRRKVSEGTKGRIEYEFARQRVTLSKEGLPERTVWLVIKRTLGADPSYSYAISNAPVSTPLRTFVWLSGVRWAIEQCFGEGKTELGMDHYEVRKYPGWHHHMLTSMLAHFFLWHVKLRLGKKSPSADGVAAADIIGSGLTPADVYHRGDFGVGRVGAAAQSPSVSIASSAAPRGRIGQGYGAVLIGK
jgi:SRSO17 transposase